MPATTTTTTMTEAPVLRDMDLKRLLESALRRPAQEGARIVALHWLQQLADARAAWDTARTSASALEVEENQETSDADILHQARVALRRLRGVLREHAGVLDESVDRRAAKALRALGQATNGARDTDVQRSWLHAEAESLSLEAREEALQLRTRLDQKATHSTAAVTKAFATHFDAVAERLFSALSTYQQQQRVGVAAAPSPFARHLATRVERAAMRLRRDLEDIQSVASREAMHRVRIRLKRQRAMLAPFAKSHRALGAWFEFATRGQDLLGAVRDADLLAERAEKEKLPVLAQALHGVALAHYDAFAHAWCAQLDTVMGTITAAVAALRAVGQPLSADGMPMEVERKYLLSGIPPEAALIPPVQIEQGWLPGTKLRERLRRTIAADGTVSLLRTMKLGSMTARVEVEEEIPEALFEAMWQLTRLARVHKARHVVSDGRHHWEIDVFLDRELVLAEVELDGTDDEAAVPGWLQPYVIRDVTGEPQYLNSVLARPVHD